MSIIEKVFRYEQTDLAIIRYKDETWFRGKSVAEILGYPIQRKAIREHVDSEDKRNCQNWDSNPNRTKRTN